jgi:hypothetical protein
MVLPFRKLAHSRRIDIKPDNRTLLTEFNGER